MTEKIRLLIVDDHKLVLEGLKVFLSTAPALEIISEAKDGLEAVEMTASLKPDVILLDLIMPKMNGIEAAVEIKKMDPNIKIIFISSAIDENQVIAALKVGASGYLLKDSSPLEIEKAILDVYQGENAFPSIVSNIMIKELSKQSETKQQSTPLTKQEVKILKLIACGLSNQEIAERLFFSSSTVKTYVTKLLGKLQVENRTQAALYAIKNGFVDLDDKTE